MAFVSLASQNAAAQDSGCGLGSMIITEQTKVMQVLAATTNSSTGTQIFGITTGTSNCKSQSIVMRDKEVQYFAEVNKEDLSREIAQGRGEKLMTLASLYGCKGDARDQFARKAQSAYQRIFTSPTTTAGEMVHNLNFEISADKNLKQSCELI
jgi:hypothetical protein